MAESDKFWDRLAANYAKSPVSDEAMYHKKLAETQSLFTPDMRIVEIGCGTGTTAIHHAPHVAHIDAIDISENMLEIGRTKARTSGTENITFTRSTLTDFNADAASVDAVLALNVIHLLADRQAIMAEVARILKPSGVFVSSTVCLGHSYLRFIRLVVPLAKMLGLMPDIFMLTQAGLADELTNAGLVVERQWHHGKNGIGVFMVARKV